ncbi:(4Fe-4S)-binding protein [uncultured Tenacibaculum sp.]|uniref:(4Fe-4S)-binding protein n=1 Tax=uncultured Tenacibaculum sp. TaxID=174713 RepID=UPI00261E0C21|nr:(4Fe-4S)-binding protein [uncultured Tenacibaculum sp.]
MDKEIIKEYSNGELTIVWKPKTCIHAAECVKALPKVYNPKARPWLKIENATTEELRAQIKKCPSGALSYYMNDKDNKEAETLETKVEVLENGPLLVYGTLKVTDKDGNTEAKNKTTAFCRCGHSDNKPYCDGAHIKSGFNG